MGFNDNSPTDDWDNWGATEDVTPQSSDEDNFGQQQDSWDDFGNDQQDDWNNFGNDQQGDSQSQDDWDNWDSQSQEQQTFDDNQSGSFLEQSSDDWNDFDNQGAQVQEESFDDFNNQSSFNASPIQESNLANFNFSSKKVACILAGVLVLLALVFMFFDKLHINKKPVQESPQQTVEQQVNEPHEVEEPQQQQHTQVNTSEGSVTLVEIPSSTTLNYSGDVLEANGTVSSKTKYVQGHQVLYCITITLTFGSSSEAVNYYCNYASYNAVSVGDIVVVSYQQVEDSYISINAISK